MGRTQENTNQHVDFGRVDWIYQAAMINNRIRKFLFLDAPIIYRHNSCINLSATYLIRPHHNNTPTTTRTKVQQQLWKYKTTRITWLSVAAATNGIDRTGTSILRGRHLRLISSPTLDSRLTNKYRTDIPFGLNQPWKYRTPFIEFFFFVFSYFSHDLYTSHPGLDMRNSFYRNFLGFDLTETTTSYSDLSASAVLVVWWFDNDFEWISILYG